MCVGVFVSTYIYIYIFFFFFNWSIGVMGTLFANYPGDEGSIPG